MKWLKEKIVEYRDIQIKESNLDWIEDNKSQDLPLSLVQMINDPAAKNLPASVDLGLTKGQTLSGLQCESPKTCEIGSVLGILPSLALHIPKEIDAQVIQILTKELDIHNKKNHATSYSIPICFSHTNQ